MKNRSHTTALLALAFVFAPVAASLCRAQAPIRVGEEFAIRIESDGVSDLEAADNGRGKVFTLRHPGATYVAIHFADFDLGPGESLTVSDAEGGQAYTLTGRGKMDAGTFWSRHVKGDTAVLELVRKRRARGKGFAIDAYAAGFVSLDGPVATEAICGADEKANAICAAGTTEYVRSRAVARLLVSGSGFCTGWLASASNHLVTNQHCIGTASAALNTDYEFMAEAPTCESSNCQLCWSGAIYSGATLVRANATLDYAVVRITTGNPAAAYGWLEIDNRTAVPGEEIYIPQHPLGKAKQIAIRDSASVGEVCRVSSVTAPGCSSTRYRDVGYLCDTEGGSSGSPVLARSSHRVIALHHCAGCPNQGVPINLVCTEICSILGAGSGCIGSADCGDGNACTSDVCNANGACSNPPVSCNGSDGCCPAGCVFPGDPDCPPPLTCRPRGAVCTTNAQCCSKSCPARTGYRICR